MKSTLHDIEVYLHHETEKAWLVSLDGERAKAVWVPKSAAELEKRPNIRVWMLTAPEALLTEKGLV